MCVLAGSWASARQPTGQREVCGSAGEDSAKDAGRWPPYPACLSPCQHQAARTLFKVRPHHGDGLIIAEMYTECFLLSSLLSSSPEPHLHHQLSSCTIQSKVLIWSCAASDSVASRPACCPWCRHGVMLMRAGVWCHVHYIKCKVQCWSLNWQHECVCVCDGGGGQKKEDKILDLLGYCL